MDSLGIAEVKSIASGVLLADAMVKEAEVALIRAQTICSGRFLIFVGGDRSSVSRSIQMAEDSGRSLSGCFVISNITQQLMDVLQNGTAAPFSGALAVVECRNVSAGIAAADTAIKQSAVQLHRLVTGQGINGKSFFVLGGELSSVREGVAAAVASLGTNLLETVVIPRPDAAVVRSLVRGVK